MQNKTFSITKFREKTFDIDLKVKKEQNSKALYTFLTFNRSKSVNIFSENSLVLFH
jgi:hypothetical protein